MRRLRAWIVRFWHALGFSREDVADEIQANLQLEIEDYIRQGLTPDEALRRAVLNLGAVEAVKETYRDRRGIPVVEHFLRDLRYALRTLRWGTSWTAIGTLAVAIGMTTATVAILDALVLRPVPFPDADRLARVLMRSPGTGRPPTWPVFRAWKTNPTFEAVEGMSPGSAVLETEAGPVATSTAFVTAGLFDMLGVRPIRGRAFTQGNHATADTDSVLISEDLWRRSFNGEPSIVGRVVKLDAKTVTVIGVLPGDFRFPDWKTEVWRLLPDGSSAVDRPAAIARFSRRIPRADALRMATEAAHQADPSTSALWADTFPLAGWTFDRYYIRALPLLSGGVAFVFLALCLNVSGLFLARFNAERRQFSLCAALGASRGRLLAQAFVRCALIVFVGTLAGIVLAQVLVRIVRDLIPAAFLTHTLHPLHIDARLLLVAAGLGAIASLAAGLVPAWIATRPDLGSSFRVVERGGTESRHARTLTRSFLVAEIALACILLVGTVLLVRSFRNLAARDHGLDPHGLLVVTLSLNGQAGRDPESRRHAVTLVEQELRSLPGVTRFAWSSGAPMAPYGNYFYDWKADAPGAAAVNISVVGASVGGDFFDVYGIRMVRGRHFQPGDPSNAVVIEDRMARALWGDADPVGHTFTWGRDRSEVVGVVGDLHRSVVDAEHDQPMLFLPLDPGRGVTATLQCGDSCPSEGVIRQRVVASGASFDVRSAKLLTDTYAADLELPRIAATVASLFAAIALIAAAGGLFSVLSYAVGRRRREFGVRSALGASSLEIANLVLKDGLLVAFFGIAIGSLGAWLLARALASLEFGVTVADPLSWVLVLGTVVLTTLFAGWRPARSAMRVNPVLLLKEE
jgi:predicted permease